MSRTTPHQDRISDKDFENLRDRFALNGRRLYRTDPSDGRVFYFIEQLGLIQLADLDTAIDILRALEVL